MRSRTTSSIGYCVSDRLLNPNASQVVLLYIESAPAFQKTILAVTPTAKATLNVHAWSLWRFFLPPFPRPCRLSICNDSLVRWHSCAAAFHSFVGRPTISNFAIGGFSVYLEYGWSDAEPISLQKQIPLSASAEATQTSLASLDPPSSLAVQRRVHVANWWIDYHGQLRHEATWAARGYEISIDNAVSFLRCQDDDLGWSLSD